MHKIRITVTAVLEYTPNPDDYANSDNPRACITIQDIAKIDKEYYLEWPSDLADHEDAEVTVTAEAILDPDVTDPVPEDNPL